MAQPDHESIPDTPLGRWVKAFGEGGIAYLARAAGLTWPSVAAIVKGQSTPRVRTARAISRATDGTVSVAEILGLDEHDLIMSAPSGAGQSAS